MNLLLSNLDNLLKLVPSNMTSNSEYRSGLNDVKSFRIDTGLYAEVKNRSAKNNINIAEILNRALEDYLKNYL
ncbi:ribbon-helix-helix domain-containing protein [Clostridium algidicarnis]|uniref:ribbon-helix-helix domain-containing protein n=1 Tax=Clostridium algidicarnis TaxID=37659 RepID=UPI001C0AC2BF|nr:ribbon-helix-helix domain-containing protein [Clostridium algidicarnis]MBU3195028.1 ribbon-helix-helix domain-containing protein [Clostridium algidicarnis]